MNKIFISVCRFLLVACPALIAFNNLQAHPICQINPAQSTIATSADSSVDESFEAGRTFSAGDVLPLNKSSVDINWVTPNDSTSDRFEIERSFDAQNFQIVGMIFTSDDRTLAANHYSFSDKSTLLAHHTAAYYRVKQVDVNGNSIYSTVQSVSLNDVTRSNNSTVAAQKAPDHADWKVNSATNNQPVITGLFAKGHKVA